MTASRANLSDDGHAGDLVSALLDGELDADTAAAVEAHLEDCPSCGRIAEEAAAARSWLAELPVVDATPVVENAIAHRRRLVGTGLVFVGIALFGLGILAMTASVIHPAVAPDVDELVAAHTDADHHEMDGMEPADEPGSRYAAPVSLVGAGATLEREALFDRRDLTTVVYDDGGDGVTVSQQPGRLDWDRLPDGDIEQIAGRRVWTRPGVPVVAVTEVGDLVVTVVGDDLTAARAVIDGLPAPERSSTLDRVHDSCQRLIEIFALGG
ncbi:MAG: zf-HC2 domain-containing protein [Acidimicrobiales bacterium]|nr:zf-HC2 domain-containing protein [Acidimicrobiales bacterium]